MKSQQTNNMITVFLGRIFSINRKNGNYKKKWI
jgi:hypothetical protein